MEKIVRLNVRRAYICKRQSSYANLLTQIFIRDKVRKAKVRTQEFVWDEVRKVNSVFYLGH